MKRIIMKRDPRWNVEVWADNQLGLGAQVFWFRRPAVVRIGLWLWLGPFDVTLDWCRTTEVDE